MGESLEDAPRPMERTLEIPVSITPTDAIRAMRLVGEEFGWKMNRFQDSTLVQRWAIIVPLAKSARVLGLKIVDGEASGLSIRSWSYVPGSAGRVSFVSFSIPEEFEGEGWMMALQRWVSFLPRCPWRWSFMERSIIGYLLPEFRNSRKKFAKEGMDIKRWHSDDVDS